jgi:hypothetical protein
MIAQNIASTLPKSIATRAGKGNRRRDDGEHGEQRDECF